MLSCSCSCSWIRGRLFVGFLEGIRIGFVTGLSNFLFLALVIGSLCSADLCPVSLLPCANSPKTCIGLWNKSSHLTVKPSTYSICSV
ncbi:hypothetical protein PR202_ga03324 [Eleusine coracana subsp. coracana]|uniref:Uncharacterized protein n=1 Tax=Eleusine coracana subsp. coracana TaxID=191504 RepID=A0AAV5BLL7_ELECO|nr:hypothetical protein PR202_ga03324 [Eleusine coracana subsp. coracana]